MRAGTIPRLVLVGLAGVLVLPLVVGFLALPGPASAAGPSCTPAGATGLTAAVVASPDQTIRGVIDGTGCDLGVYVGPGVSDVLISGATITGAYDHGILIQDTSDVTVENSRITGNGVSPTPGVIQNKAIALVGTSDSVVRGNIVTGNLADGGIAVLDDGPIDPGAPGPGSPRPATGNTIVGNDITGNMVGCGIVLAAFNVGEGVDHNLVARNSVSHNPAGIIVAADTPGTSATHNWVFLNTITDNFLPGVIIHSNAPGDTVAGTVVLGNRISGNGFDPEVGLTDPTKGAGIIVVGAVAPVTDTRIVANRITSEYYGVWESNTTNTRVVSLGLNKATVPVYPLP